MDFFLAGVAAIGAGTCSNPLEVVKIRMQLQGELQARGNYQIHYKNAFHAFYTIGRRDGIFALQKGLVPALGYQFVMNGARLGSYAILDKHGFTRNKNGKVDPIKSIIYGGFAGAFGSSIASPFYLAKTQLQSKANDFGIAVGYQHKIKNMSSAFREIFKKHGIIGLWRGTSSQIARMFVSSSIQLGTFEKSLEYIRSKKYFPEKSWINAFLASASSGSLVTLGMSPFDVIATRIYNQPVCKSGKGLTYKSLIDCAGKIYLEEGFLAFFKGWTAAYFRNGPHLVLLFVFWDQLKNYHQMYSQKIK